jgi:hypothetical protein
MGLFRQLSAATTYSVIAAIPRLQVAISALSRELGNNPKTTTNGESASRSSFARHSKRTALHRSERSRAICAPEIARRVSTQIEARSIVLPNAT